MLWHFISVWQQKAFEAQRIHPPPLQGIPLRHNLIFAVGALRSRTASGLCQPCFMCAQDRAARKVPPFRTSGFTASPRPSPPGRLALTSGASGFMSINLPLHFMVTKLKCCVSDILAFSMFCKVRTVSETFLCSPLKCTTSKGRAPARRESRTGMNFIGSKKGGVGGQSERFSFYLFQTQGFALFFMGSSIILGGQDLSFIFCLLASTSTKNSVPKAYRDITSELTQREECQRLI